MAEFGEPEITADATTLDHRDIRTFKHTFDHQCCLPALFQRLGIHKGCIDITRPVSSEYDQQEECFHVRGTIVKQTGLVPVLMVTSVKTVRQCLSMNDKI